MKRSTTLLSLTLCLLVPGIQAFAQMTNSEKRQQQKLEQQNEKVFGDDDPSFKVTTIPDKWKNESAVIIAQNVEFDYYYESRMAHYDEIVRKRIMLLDKNAVEENSTFKFFPNQEVGFRVIKKDGTVKKISTTEAIDIKEALPDNFHMFGISNSALYADGYAGYKKLAIPDLEPGDIIDFYYVYTHAYDPNILAGVTGTPYTEAMAILKYCVPMPAVIFTLAEEYPIMKQKIEFYVQKGFYINFNSSNGAPKLSESEQVDKKTKLFALKDEDRDRLKDEIWKYDYRSEPTVKFQVVYTSEHGKDEVPYFLGEPYVPQTSVPQDLLQGVADQVAMEKVQVSSNMADAVIKYMKKYHKNEPDSVKYMQYAYYYLRNYLFVQKRREIEEKEEKKDMLDYINEAYKGIVEDPTDDVDDGTFVKALGLVARDNGIEYQLEFGVPRSIGTLDNLVLRDDMKWLIRIRGKKDMILYPLNGFSVPDEPRYYMEGVNAYYIIPSNDFKKIVMNKTSVPVSPYADNMTSFKMDVSFGASMDASLSIARTAKISGEAKNGYYPDVLVKDQYENQELKKFGMTTDMDDINSIHNEKKKAEALKQFNDDLADQTKKRLDIMKNSLKDDFDVDTYDDFQLTCSGIEMDSTTLMFNDKFKIKNLVKKVGPNYMMEVGKLIGGQLELKDKDSLRRSDVNMPFARETDYELDINIPNGYKVEGVDGLNMNVTNNTGGFVSTAKVNGNKLVVQTRKFYANNCVPASGWEDMKKFLYPAYNFSQKKILLKKA